MKCVVAASVAVFALGVLVPAFAQDAAEVVITGHKSAAPGAETQSKTVSYRDLDISNSSGIRTLLVRIRGAAGDVCAPQPLSRDVAGSTDYRRCVTEAVNTAVAKVNSPGLTALTARPGH